MTMAERVAAGVTLGVLMAIIGCEGHEEQPLATGGATAVGGGTAGTAGASATGGSTGGGAGGGGVGGSGGGYQEVEPLPDIQCTHYVDGSQGSDGNDGTSEASAWQTIQHAADSLEPGETVCILAGIYAETTEVVRSGAPAAFITFAARPGDDVLIDGTGIDVGTGGLFEVHDASYVRISGIRVEHSSWAAILARRTEHLVIDGNSTYETMSSGIGVWQSDDVRIEGNEVRRARYAAGGAQEWITMGSGTNFLIRGNVIHDGVGTDYPYVLAIDAKHSHGGVIERNHIYDVAGSAIYVDGWDTHTYDIVIRNNFLHDVSRGVSIGSERGALVEEIDIYNNVVVRASNSGIQLSQVADDGPRERIRIFNNTIFESVQHGGGGIYVQTTNVSEITIRNNVVAFGPNWQGMLRATSPNGITADHNLIFGESKFPEEELAGSIEGDPLFADTSSDEADGFRLLPGSPAIDTGSGEGAPARDYSGAVRPADGNGDGTAEFDMGVFELAG